MAVEQKVRGILILRVPSTGDVTTVLNDDLGLSHASENHAFFHHDRAMASESPDDIDAGLALG